MFEWQLVPAPTVQGFEEARDFCDSLGMKLPIPGDMSEVVTFAGVAGGPYWLGLARECGVGPFTPCTDYTSIYEPGVEQRNASMWAEGVIEAPNKVGIEHP